MFSASFFLALLGSPLTFPFCSLVPYLLFVCCPYSDLPPHPYLVHLFVCCLYSALTEHSYSHSIHLFPFYTLGSSCSLLHLSERWSARGSLVLWGWPSLSVGNTAPLLVITVGNTAPLLIVTCFSPLVWHILMSEIIQGLTAAVYLGK